MNFNYDPSRHPPEVGRVLRHMTNLINTGKRSRQDIVGALCDAMEVIAKEDGVAYETIQEVVFAAMDRDNGKVEPVQ
jgi:hypothetical protein